MSELVPCAFPFHQEPIAWVDVDERRATIRQTKPAHEVASRLAWLVPLTAAQAARLPPAEVVAAARAADAALQAYVAADWAADGARRAADAYRAAEAADWAYIGIRQQHRPALLALAREASPHARWDDRTGQLVFPEGGRTLCQMIGCFIRGCACRSRSRAYPIWSTACGRTISWWPTISASCPTRRP